LRATTVADSIHFVGKFVAIALEKARKLYETNERRKADEGLRAMVTRAIDMADRLSAAQAALKALQAEYRGLELEHARLIANYNKINPASYGKPAKTATVDVLNLVNNTDGSPGEVRTQHDASVFHLAVGGARSDEFRRASLKTTESIERVRECLLLGDIGQLKQDLTYHEAAAILLGKPAPTVEPEKPRNDTYIVTTVAKFS
jgi:hypothetical protein